LTEKGAAITDTTRGAYMNRLEMLDLIRFFYSEEFEHICLDMLRIRIEPAAIRDRLGLSPRLFYKKWGKDQVARTATVASPRLIPVLC
jgi:hypothetical protein